MDNFGDYVDRPRTPPSVATKIFVSSTFDDFGGLRRLLQGLPATIDVPIEIHNLGDERPHIEEAKAKVQALALRVVAERLEHGEAGPDLVSISFAAA